MPCQIIMPLLIILLLLSSVLYSAEKGTETTKYKQYLNDYMRVRGDAPGNLLFVCRGMKLDKGFAGLPVKIRDFVIKNNSEYQNPPVSGANPTKQAGHISKK